MPKIRVRCGHDSYMGVGDLCMDCHKAGFKVDKPKKPKKPEFIGAKRPRGRPVWKTEEEKRETAKNRNLRRANYLLEYSRKRRNVLAGQFVVYNNGKWRCKYRAKGYHTFDEAKVYTTYGLALKYAEGEIMELMDTEAKTLAVHEAKQLKEMKKNG